MGKSLKGIKLSMSKIKSMKNMLCRAFKERIHVDYVLMDIWFTFYDLSVTLSVCGKNRYMS